MQDLLLTWVWAQAFLSPLCYSLSVTSLTVCCSASWYSLTLILMPSSLPRVGMKNQSPTHLTALPTALSHPASKTCNTFPSAFPNLLAWQQGSHNSQPKNQAATTKPRFPETSSSLIQLSVTSSQPQSLQISTQKPQTHHMQAIRALTLSILAQIVVMSTAGPLALSTPRNWSRNWQHINSEMDPCTASF